MYFDRVFITAEGYELLGAATAGSSGDGSNSPKIFWENAITSSNSIADWSQSQINGATSGDFPTDTYTSSGSVTSAVHSQKDKTVDDQTIKVDVVTVTIDINNNQYSGIANTLCIFARLDSGESKLVIIASADNPDTVHPLPEPYNALLDLYIELSGTAVSEVSADQSWYASADAFNKIANRVVTTHSEDSSTVGEDQDVYGEKTFKGDMYTSNVVPSGNLTVDLGDTAHRYSSVFARSVNQSVLECSTAASTAAKLIVSEQTQNFSTPKLGDRVLVKFINGNSSAVPTIQIGNDRNSQAHAILGLRTNLEENSIVPLTFNGSSWDVGGVSSVAKQAGISVKGESSDYSLVFTDVATRQLIDAPLNRELYIDANTTGTLKYNPSTNTLTCSTFDGEVTRLSDDPVLNFTNATHSGNSILGSTLTVEAGGKTSNSVTVGTVRQAYDTFIRVSSESTEYKLPFTPFSSTSTFRTLYTDDNTSSSLKYNPSTHTLSTNTLKCASLNVSGSLNVSESLNVFNSINLRFLALYIKNPSNKTLYVRSESYSAAAATGDYILTGYDTMTGSGNSWVCPVTRYCTIGGDSNFNLSAMGGYSTAMASIARFKMLTMIKLEPDSTKWYPAIILSNV